ncbi:MAG: hypothetical protein OJF52_003317 [Nitrospira sp.]|nr:MAG: hypothetical protein OJF52_003317 [Nitrospira sp.]
MILLKSLVSPVMHLCLGALAGWVPGPAVALLPMGGAKVHSLRLKGGVTLRPVGSGLGRYGAMPS